MSKFDSLLNDQGKVTRWPAKYALKLEVIKYIGDKFEKGHTYNEKEVNNIINQWHTFGDYFIIRRGLVDYKLLARTKDGAKYWKIEDK